MPTCHPWSNGLTAWSEFVKRHPELGYRAGKWPFHNFLRYVRRALVQADAIRVAKRRFWIAHRIRFNDVAFACASGQLASVTEPRRPPEPQVTDNLSALCGSRTARGRQQRPPDETSPAGRPPPPTTGTPARGERFRRPKSCPPSTTSSKNRSQPHDR